MSAVVRVMAVVAQRQVLTCEVILNAGRSGRGLVVMARGTQSALVLAKDRFLCAAVAGMTQQAFTLRDARMRLCAGLVQLVTIPTDGRLWFRQQRVLLFLVENVALQTLAIRYGIVGHPWICLHDLLVALAAAVNLNLILKLAGVRIVAQCTFLRLLGVRSEGYTLLYVISVAAGAEGRHGFAQDGCLFAAVAGMAQQTLLGRNGRMGLFRHLVVALTTHLPLRCFEQEGLARRVGGMATETLSLGERVMDMGGLFGVDHLPVAHAADFHHRPPQLFRVLLVGEVMTRPTLLLRERWMEVGGVCDRRRPQNVRQRRRCRPEPGCRRRGRQFLWCRGRWRGGSGGRRTLAKETAPRQCKKG